MNMKKRSNYRIVKTFNDKNEEIFYVEYRDLFVWRKYTWLSQHHSPEPDIYTSICTSKDMAMEKLKECKGLRTFEVVYEE